MWCAWLLNGALPKRGLAQQHAKLGGGGGQTHGMAPSFLLPLPLSTIISSPSEGFPHVPPLAVGT